MSKVGAVVKLVAQPGKRDELASALKVMFDAVEAEPGTLMYILHSDNSEEDVLWFYELYSDNVAFAAHGAGDTFKALGPSLGGRPELHLVTPLGGKGL